MPDPSPSEAYLSATVHRLVTMGFGILFVAIAVALLIITEPSWRTVLGAIVIGGLGADAVVSAARKKKALLARIGPLP
ncbi:MAG: hypothetical protein ABIW85_09185 [Variovorax sp.]